MPHLDLATPIGRLRLETDGRAITSILWAECKHESADAEPSDPCALLEDAAAAIEAYFARARPRFAFPLAARGTAFQQRVWAAIRDVPYGQTLSYGELARRLGSGPRAVGQACGRNPILIATPCHRILAANGLGGFGGRASRTEIKTQLLALEARDAHAIHRMTRSAADDIFAHRSAPA